MAGEAQVPPELLPQLRLLEALVEQAPVGVAVYRLVDPADPGSLTLTYVNPAVARLGGMDLAPHLGRRIDDFAPHLVALGRAAVMARVIATGRTEALPPVHYGPGQPVAGSRDLWLEARVFRVADDLGAVFLEDVTRRHEAEVASARTQAALRRTNAELEQFAFAASHDLQEPLRKVRAFGDRLRDRCADGLDDRGRDYLARMQGAAARMQVLVEDLLSLSRVERHGQDFAPLSLAEVVARVEADLARPLAEAGATLVIGPLPAAVGDARQLQQALRCVLDNAAKFRRPEVPLRIAVSGRRVEDGDGVARVEVEVADNGIGFEPHHAERILAPFQRLHGRDAYPGTGIGLALARKIAVRHGGDLRATGEPGVGATFTLSLAVDAPTPPEAP